MTLLSYDNKYVVSSTTAVSTTSSSFVDDTEASVSFTLSASRVVLVIYQANSVYGATMYQAGMYNAINVDGSDVAISMDSPYQPNYPMRNCTFWVGTMNAGSHTVKGRFRTPVSGNTVTVSNRVLLVYIFNGDEYYYTDYTYIVTSSSTTFADDPYAQVTLTPSASCKALILYNATNCLLTDNTGKKVAVNVNGTDYGQAEKSGSPSNNVDSVFTAHVLSLSAASTTFKGRFAVSSGSITCVDGRQFAVLLLDDSTLIDVVTSTTQVSTTSGTLVDDPQASISRTTTDTRELLAIAVGTKRSGVSSSIFGECYGVQIDGVDRANSRGSPYGASYPNSAATAYAIRLSAGSHTVKGRFSANYSGYTAVISARQVLALWLVVGVAYVQTVSDSGRTQDVLMRRPLKCCADVGKVADAFSRRASMIKIVSEAGKAFDYLKGFASFHVSFVDAWKAADRYGRIVNFARALVEAGRGYDYVKRGVLKRAFDWAIGEPTPVALYGKILTFYDAGRGADALARAASFHVRPVDVVESYDYLKRAALKPMFDASRTYDYVSRGVLRVYADVVLPDYGVSRGFGFYRYDVSRSADYVSRGFVKSYADVGRGYDYALRASLKRLIDSVRSYDYVGRGFLKPLSETFRGLDAAYRGLGRIVVDYAVASDRLVRDVLKRFSDIGRGADVLARGFFKQFEFEGVPYGYVGLGYGKIVSDYAVASERFSTALAKRFVEFIVVRDAPYRVVSLVLRDTFLGDYDSLKGVGKSVVEAPVVVSDVMFKGLGKVLADSVKGLEVVRRGFGKTLADFVLQEPWISRGVSLSAVDVSVMADVITKVAFTLAGYNVRRVYALPREWADIIEAEDHNRRVLASRALLEAIKRLKGELEQL